MIHHSIAIAALARNCETNLPGNIKRIEELRRIFDKSWVFVYENDSTDSTKSILDQWATSSNDVIVKQEHLEEMRMVQSATNRFYKGVSLSRMNRMSFCRNCLLNMIKAACTPDYVLFVDSDILSFSVEGVVKSITQAPQGWGALFANCYMTITANGKTKDIPIYYDTFPYIATSHKVEAIRQFEISQFYRFFVSKKLYALVQQQDYFQCDSSFGGIGIYRYDCIKDLEYKPFRPERWELKNIAMCEHVYFNMNIHSPKFISRELRSCYADYSCHGIKGWLLQHFPTLYVLCSNLHNMI